MRQQLKKTGLLLTVIFLLFGLVSCGEKGPAVQVFDDLEAQPVYLNFFSIVSLSGSDIGKYWSDRFAEKYNKQVYVNYDGASYYAEEGLSYRELLSKRINSSMPDDLYIINAEDVIEFEKKGYWMDLSGLDFVANLSEEALYQSTYNGKVFSVPLTFTGFGFYWNVKLLEEYGLTIPENEAEFMKVCETLKSQGIVPYGANKGYALTVPAMCKGLADLYGSADQQQRIADLNSGAVPISSYMRTGYEFLSEMIDRGYLDPRQALNTAPGDDMELLVNGECAFICIGLGAALREPEKEGYHFEMTGLPVLEDRSICVYGADSRLCVNPYSKHLETALEFIEMVGTKEALDASAEMEHVMSSARDSEAGAFSGERKMCELLRQPGQIPNQDFSLHFNTWESIRDVGREICGGLSVDEACAKLDAMQRAELASYASQ